MHPSGLPDDELNEIESHIGDASAVHCAIAEQCIPDLIEFMYLPARTKKGIAWVCLNDAADMLEDSRFALFQTVAFHGAYDRLDESNVDARYGSLVTAQFYLDDTVLRLFATAESVAAAVKSFHEVELLEAYEAQRKASKERASEFIKLCAVVRAARLDNEATRMILALGTSDAAIWVTNYRNDWMHGQRHRMEGSGLGFNRAERAHYSATSKGGTVVAFAIGVQGDPSRLTIGDAVEKVTYVYHALRDLIIACREAFAADLPASGPGWEQRPSDTGISIGSPSETT